MFLVTLTLDGTQREAIARLTPSEQARIAELMAQGTISARYIQADFSRIWLVFAGQDEAQVRAILAGLPLYPYMASLDVVALATLPAIS